jgi:hypothetical protein
MDTCETDNAANLLVNSTSLALYSLETLTRPDGLEPSANRLEGGCSIH